MLGIGGPTDRTSCLLICAAPPLHPCGSLASHPLRRPPPPHLQLPDPLRRPPPRRSAGREADGIGTTEFLLVAWLVQLRAEVLLRARPRAELAGEAAAARRSLQLPPRRGGGPQGAAGARTGRTSLVAWPTAGRRSPQLPHAGDGGAPSGVHGRQLPEIEDKRRLWRAPGGYVAISIL